MAMRHGFSTNSGPGPALVRAVAIGTVASLAVHGALVVFGRRTGRGAMAPINATSHVIHGPEAGSVDRVDLSHTATGVVINHGASIFWALPLAWWLTQGRERSAAGILLGASATGVVAGVVDYGLIPRRLSPGWHHSLPPKWVAGTFGALAAGIALGAVLTRPEAGP